MYCGDLLDVGGKPSLEKKKSGISGRRSLADWLNRSGQNCDQTGFRDNTAILSADHFFEYFRHRNDLDQVNFNLS